MGNENWAGDGWYLRQVSYQQVTEQEGICQVGDWCYSQLPIDSELWKDVGHAPWPFHLVKPHKLGDRYFQHNKWRQPIVVLMPGRTWFCLDGKAHNEQGYYGEGWTVVGDPAAGSLTVHPSIDIGGSYHGWLHQNKISRDCEGRQYDPETGYLRALPGA